MFHRTRIKHKYLNKNPTVQIRNQNVLSVNNTQLLGVKIDQKSITKSIDIINTIRKLTIN